MARLHRCHAGLFTMRDIAKSYCEECINSCKNRKSVLPGIEVASMGLMEVPNPEFQVDFLRPLQSAWVQTNKY